MEKKKVEALPAKGPVYDIKNPKGFTVNGQSFNEFFVTKKTLPEFIDYGMQTYAENRPFFGNGNEQQKRDLLTKVWNQANEMVNPAKAPAAPVVEKPKEEKPGK